MICHSFIDHIIRLINVIKKEEAIVRDKIRLYEIDPINNTVEARKRRSSYVRNDEQIQNLFIHFDDRARNNQPNNVLQHLRALQYRLKDFELWN